MNRLKSFLRPHRSLTPDGGISFTLVIVLSVVAAFMGANIYYNQPLLDVIRQEMHTSEVAANFVTVVAQVGYALALFFVIPLGDFMTIYFIFGAMGTMLSGLAWNWMGWTGVSAIGLAFAMTSIVITMIGKRH